MAEKADKAGRAEVKARRKEPEEPAISAADAALDRAAAQFKALGDPTRLRIIKLLSNTPEVESDAENAENTDSAVTNPADPLAGRTVGDVSQGVFGKSKVSSTLSHHLKELRNAGLITMKRRGKNLICRIDPKAIEGLRGLLAAERPARRGPVKKTAEKELPDDNQSLRDGEDARDAPAI